MFAFDLAWDIQHLLNQFWSQIQFLLLVTVITLAYVSYKKPAYGAGLTIILLPSYLFRSNFYLLPFTFLELCIWILFLGWSLNLLKQNKFSARALIPYRPQIFLIIVASIISLFIAPNLTAAAGLWKAYIVEPILFFTVLYNIYQNTENKKIILWSLGISTLSISLLAIYQKFTGFGIFEPSWTGPENRRVTAFFSSPNAVGLYLAPVIMIYTGWLMSELNNKKESILKGVIIALSLIAIVFTVSQGTWLGLLVALFFMLFFGWNKKITAGLVGAVIILILIVPTTRDKVMPIVTLQDTSGKNRTELWSLAAQNLSSPKTFLLGNGIFGFSQIQNEARDPLKIEPLLYPHNILLNFWTELGLLGTLGFAWLIFTFFKNGFEITKNKWLTLGIMAAMITILTHGLIDVPYFKNDLAVLFWIIIALL